MAMSQAPQERVPCIVHLDEAGYWIPQDAVTYLSKSTRLAMADAFHKLAACGRKMGLVPFLYTQSISEVGKSSIRQSGVKVLMCQTLDTDLNRYSEYIHNATPRTRKAIQAFPTGKAIVHETHAETHVSRNGRPGDGFPRPLCCKHLFLRACMVQAPSPHSLIMDYLLLCWQG